MNRALLVAQREFLENIRTKGFWIGILMMPIMLCLIGIIPLIVESTREVKKFVVIDNSGWLLERLIKEIEATDFAYYLAEPISKKTRTPLDTLKTLVTDLSDVQIQSISRHLTNLESDNEISELQLPDSLINHINENRVDIERWWRSLSADEKAGLSARISLNSFRLVRETDTALDSLNEAIQSKSLFAYFIIGEDPIKHSKGARYVSNNLTDRDLLNWFSGFVSSQIRKLRLQQENLDRETASWINQSIVFDGMQISDDGSTKKVDSQDVVRQWAPVVFVYLLWISILINTQLLLTNTIEEKSNKLIEVLLSSISPIVLMAGKILGIAATGLTIILSWALMIFSFFILIPQALGTELPINLAEVAVDPWFLGSFLVYYLLGYLLYAALLVGIGSVCSNLKEAQNLLLPVQLVQILPILLMVPIGRDPNGALAQTLSYIPPLTPFVMMNRAAGPPSTTEYAVTTTILVISIMLALWVAAKVFRIGILITGKPPSIKEIIHWIRAPVIQTEMERAR